MEFDHVQGDKVANPSSMTGKEFFEEIEKCDMVCANCHRIRTWERNQKFIAEHETPYLEGFPLRIEDSPSREVSGDVH
jgi:hypothetical protein